MDEDFLTAVKTLRKETKTVVDDIIELIHKAEDDSRTMKTSKGKTDVWTLGGIFCQLTFRLTFLYQSNYYADV